MSRARTIVTWVFALTMVVVLGLGAVPKALAQDDIDFDDDDAWRFTVAPYIWAARLDGRVKVGPLASDVDVGFIDILKTFSIGGMLYLGARRGPVGVFVNPLFIRTKDDSSGPVDVDVKSDSALVAAGAFYRVGEWQVGEGESRPLRVVLEPYAGIRWSYVRAEIRLNEGSRPAPGELPEFDKSENWVDPIVGARVAGELTDRWVLGVAADAGGFGVGSDYSWNVQGYAAYRMTMLGVPSLLTVGYRALQQKYDRNDFEWDITQHGPILGIAYQF